MKRSELEVGQVLAYRPSKTGSCEAAVVMDTLPVREARKGYSPNAEKITRVIKGNNVHVVLLSQSPYVDGETRVVPYHRAVPLTALRGDWWAVTEALAIEHNTRRELQARQAAEAAAALADLEAVAVELAAIGIEARVDRNFRLTFELADAELLASWIREAQVELSAP